MSGFTTKNELDRDLKLAGISDPADPDAHWRLLDYIEELLDIENWEGTGDSGAYRFIQCSPRNFPSNQYIGSVLFPSRILFQQRNVEGWNSPYFYEEFWNRYYSLLFKGVRKAIEEKPEEIRHHVQLIFRLYDAYLMADLSGYEEISVELYDEYGAEFFFEEYFGPGGAEGPVPLTVDLAERLHNSGRIEDALDICRISKGYFPLEWDNDDGEFSLKLQLRIQEQFETLAELMIQEQKLQIHGQKLQKELLDACFVTLRNSLEELLAEVDNIEGASADLIAKAQSIEIVLNGVIEEIAKIRERELSTEEITSLLEDISIPISVETEVEALRSKYQTIDKLGLNIIEELAKFDHIMKHEVSGMISDLLFLKLCKTLESLMMHSIIFDGDDLKMLSDTEALSQRQIDDRIGRAEKILRSHLEGNKKLTLGSFIPLLDAIKNEKCEESVLLAELRKIHWNSLGDIRILKHFISKPEQIGDDSKSIVEMRNIAAHSILEEGVPISEENVNRLRLKLLEDSPHVLEIISRILNKNE